MLDWPDPTAAGTAVSEAHTVAKVPPPCASLTKREAYLQALDDERHLRYTSNYRTRY